MAKYHVFLGGADAEMRRIAEVLNEAGIAYSDAGLGWGAKASAYGSAIAEVAEAGFVPVLIELEVDCDVPEGTIVVDHHNERAGEPASILQVLSLLRRKPEQVDKDVAAYDEGGIEGALRRGIPAERLAALAEYERRLRGITPEMEADATQAAEVMEHFDNGVRVARLPHSQCDALRHPLLLSGYWGEEGEQLLVLSEDSEVNFFGDGSLCAALKEQFDGWAGGAGLGKQGSNGYWGGYPPHDKVLAFVRARSCEFHA